MNQLFGQSTDSGRNIESDLVPSAVPVRPLPVSGPEQAFFHLDVGRSLQLHWRLATAVASVFAVLAVAYFLVHAFVLKTWPSYEAESIIYVQPAPARVLQSAQSESARWPYDTNTYESYMQQQMMNVSREDVLINALHKLHGWQKPGEADQTAAQRLVRAINVERSNNAYQFTISARARTAQMAADVTNALMAAYLESAAKDQKNGDTERLAILKQERDRVQALLEADRTEQQGLNRELGIASVSSTIPDHYDADITQMREELVKARTDHDAAEAKFASMDAGHGPSSAAIDAEADQLIAADAGLVSMKQALNLRRATLISQMANLTPSHPQYKQDEVELAKIDGDLDSMMKNLRAKAATEIQLKLQSELQRSGGVEQKLNDQLRLMVGSAGSATPKMQRSSDLAADITRLQTRFSTIDEELHNVMLENSAPASVYPVTTAVPPLNRTKSGVVRNSFLIVFAGLFFAVLAAVTRNKLDPKVYVAADVELILGFAPMAQLPDFNEVSEGVADEFLLRLSSSIEHARQQSNLRSCVFTGVNPGNGVTTLVNRIRVMLQAMGRPTVLVDASGAPPLPDRARKNVSATTPGLVPLERVSRPTALLQQMEEETETEDEALVLTDTAPLTVSAETEYLARFVDCAIVVIESGRTTRRELRDAAATLQRLDVGAVGFVLNRVGLAKAEPSFRKSIAAIEKHLEAQAISRRAEAMKTPVPSKQPETEAPAFNNDVRAHYEPELAAVAAAVARFSSPSHIEAPACLPTPTMVAPSAEPVKVLHTDLDETTETHEDETTETHEQEVAETHEDEAIEEHEPVHVIPASFEQAAQHVVSTVSAPVVEDEPVGEPVEHTAFHSSHKEFAEEATEVHAEVPVEHAVIDEVHAEAPAEEISVAAYEVAPKEDEAVFASHRYEWDFITPSLHAEHAAVDADLDSAAHVATGNIEEPAVDAVPAFAHAEEEHAEAETELPSAAAFEAVHAEEHVDALPEVAAEHVPAAEVIHEPIEQVTAMREVSEEQPAVPLEHVDALQEVAEEQPAVEAVHEPIEQVAAVPEVAEEQPAVEADHEPVEQVAAMSDAAAEQPVAEAVPEPVEQIAAMREVVEEQPVVEAAHEPIEQVAALSEVAAEQAAVEAAPEVTEQIAARDEVPQVQAPELPKKPVVSEPAPAADLPWWLNQPAPRPGRVRPPVLWKPARVWMTEPSNIVDEPTTTEPSRNPEDPNAGAPRLNHPNTDADPNPTASVANEAESQGEAAETLTSRLSGLRNLLFVMGVKNPHGSDEESGRSRGAEMNSAAHAEGSPVEVLYPNPSREATSSNIGDASPRLVTAPPEFLPPQPIVIKVDRDERPTAEQYVRSERRGSFDGMEVMQARRSGFKKL